MWFKNCRVYRFTSPCKINEEQLNEGLTQDAFTPCGKQEPKRSGWVDPTDSDGPLFHASLGQFIVCAKTQERVLPSSVVNEHLKERIDEIKIREDRHIGASERKDIREDIVLELLPKAFSRSSRLYAYINPKAGLIVVDSASANKAEALLSLLRTSLGSLPVVPLISQQLPYKAATQWLLDHDVPPPFVLGGECQLSDPKEASSVIRCKHQDLTSSEINNHLQSGMIVTQLGLNWKDGIDFVLDDQFAIKRLKFSDDIHEQANEQDAENPAQQFDMDFSIMSIELNKLISDLLSAMGGINQDNVSVEEIVANVAKTEVSDTSTEELTFG